MTTKITSTEPEHTGHTPGPWQVISPALGHTDFGIWGPQGKPIGNVVGRSYTDNLLNARLIAAAPIGYELAELVLAIPHGIDPRTREMAKRFMRVAKAEGKPTLQ